MSFEVSVMREVEVGDELVEQEVTAEVRVYRGTNPYFSKSFGNWLPGDPDEVEIDRISIDGANVSFDEVDEKTIERIEEKALNVFNAVA